MADETWLDSPVVCKSNVANTKPLRWLIKLGIRLHWPRRRSLVANTKPLRWLMKPFEISGRGADAVVANTKPLRWLMKLYPFKHLIILHAPPSLREPSVAAGQGMPNSL